MGGVRCCLRSTSYSRWSYHSGSVRSISSSGSPDSHQESQKQLWKDFFSNPSQWWDNRLHKRSSRQPDFVSKLTRESLWLDNQCKPVWVDFQLGTLDAQLQSGLGDTRGSSILRGESLFEHRRLERGIHMLLLMNHQQTPPSVALYRTLLKACTKTKSLAQAKRVHAHLTIHGLESTIGEAVVSTLVRCGGLDDALEVFHRLPQRSAFSWTAMISGYVLSGQCREALRMYQRMDEEGVQPSKYTFANVIKACSRIADLEEGRRIHTETVKYGCESDLFVGTSLIDMYSKCGSIVEAQHSFEQLSQRNIVSWNTMLAAYVQQTLAEAALQLYERMRKEGVIPDIRTFVTMLQVCGMLAEKEENSIMNGLSVKMKSLATAKALHAEAWRKGYESDVFIGGALISIYGRCGSVVDAENRFDGLSQESVVSYNAMLSAYLQHNQAKKALHLYEQLHKEGLSPNERTFVAVLRACGIIAEKDTDCRVKWLDKGKAIHANVWGKDFHSGLFVGSTLVSTYGKCGSLVDAQNVFDGLWGRDSVSWNALLVAYVEHDQGEKALQLYEHMQEEGLTPSHRTLVSILQACGMIAEQDDDVVINGRCFKIEAWKLGKTLHGYACRSGYCSDVFVGNTFIYMYGKCGSFEDAANVFDNMFERDVVSWNVMMAVYSQHGQVQKAFELYEQMQERSVSPDDRTLVRALYACVLLAKEEEGNVLDGQLIKLKSLERGKTIHADAVKRGYGSNLFIGSALVTLYQKCGRILDAQTFFDGLHHRSVVLWNAIIAAHVGQGQGEKALDLYKQMQDEGVNPDEITSICILQACSSTGNLDVCRHIYRITLAANKLSHPLASSLIHAYGRCSSMLDAQIVFDALPQPDAVAWTGLIAGYARQGNSTLSLQRYEEMLLAGTKPDGITFLSLLAACSHAGLVEEGVDFFESMSKDHALSPEIGHYVTMVDLLGRAGHFHRVEQLLATMPMQPDLAMWLCLLAACRKHGKVVLAKQAFDGAVSLKPKHAAAYDMMSTIYADAGLPEQAKMVNDLRERAGALKKPGQSWIQHEEDIHTFLVGDHMHPQQAHIHSLLGKVSLEHFPQNH